MIKKSFILILFLLTTSCGYEAMHSKKNMLNYNFSINEVNYEGNRNINLQIKRGLSRYTLKKLGKEFRLDIKSFSTKKIVAKDTKGNPTSFKNTTMIDIVVYKGKKGKNRFKLIENFKYNNISNKFDLRRYENELEKNLAETITKELIYKLSNIQ